MTANSYEHLLELAKTTKVDNYYQTLVTHTEELLVDINKRNQGVVARDLNMSQTELSHILKLLKELHYARN